MMFNVHMSLKYEHENRNFGLNGYNVNTIRLHNATVAKYIREQEKVATIDITDRGTQLTHYIQETFSILNTDLLRLKQ